MSGWKLKKVELGRIYENLELGRLRQWTLEGRVAPSDEVQAPGASDWVAAGGLADLETCFAPAAPGAAADQREEPFEPSFRSRADEDTVEVDMTPVIDCTFLLLLFFIVTAQFSHRGITIEQPSTKTGDTIAQNSLSVQVDREGRIFFEGKEVTVPMFGRARPARGAETKRKSLVIDADRRAAHGIVVQIMDQARQAGIEDCKFPTKSLEREQ